MVILPGLVGLKINIYNGKEFVSTEITFEMLGHKFGEFAVTRTKTKHSKEEKAGKNKKEVKK